MTFEVPVWPTRGRFVSTTTSALASGCPSAAVATSGSARRMFTASRVMPLEISLSAPLRSTSRLSFEPVSSSAAWKPEASAIAPIRIATVNATPSAVVAVETGRCRMLRRL